MLQLKTQLENAEEIRNILKKVDVNWTIEDIPVDAQLIYLPCAGDKCDTSQFYDLIKNCLLTNFVFSHEHIQKKLELKNSEAADILFQRAVGKLSKKTAHGELGELILFTLLDVYLNAPKILSKVSMKTSRRMPVYGADAVHAQFVDNELRLYLGESKLYKSFNSGAKQAAKSIACALDNYDNDFNLIETYINFPNIDEDFENKLLSALDPFDNDDIGKHILYSPCFIGFEEPNCFKNKEKYIDIYKEKAANYISYFYSKLINNGLPIGKTTLLMLPFSSIKDIVDGFIEHTGINI